jgi:hypothetical protein
MENVFHKALEIPNLLVETFILRKILGQQEQKLRVY